MLKKTYLVAILLAICVALVPGCKKSGMTGVSDKEIVVGITGPLTGPAAPWGNLGKGAKAWADYVNAQGGVNGRMIKVILKDDGYNPAKALANLQEMKGQIFAGIGLLGTAVVNTCRDFFPDNKIVLVNAYGNTRMWVGYPKEKMKYVFVSYPDYEDEAEWLTEYAYKNLGSRSFSIFYQNDDFGKLGLVGVEKAIKKLSGAKLIGKISYEVSEKALSTHALKLKESGADTILLYPTPTQGAIITKEIGKIGYNPKIMASFPLGDPIMFKLADKAWEGVYPAIAGQYSLPGADVAGDKVLEILKKYAKDITSDSFAVFGASSMMHFVEALKKCGKDVNTESFIKAMESISNFKPEGMGGPVTYTPTQHHGLNSIRLFKASNGKLVPMSDYIIFKPYF